ncbi:MAG TPA: hypothetical protein VLE69_00455 [Candidatus Saccharimonadales bacterium]|nr:hypothetical protein [Candidatus Saccharimonadales bacterium]
MSNLLIAFLLAAGSGAWIYAKMYRQSGGLRKQALIVAGISGLVVLLITWTLLNTILH